jgi:hypothetical protein
MTPGSSAYYADQLASSVSSGIVFTMLEIFPENLRKPVQYETELKSFTIHITGECYSPATMAGWIAKLVTVAWVDRIENQTYKWNSKRNIGQFSFVIRIRQL